ncbi:hypothetical protein TRFO_25327 [Tritrichomonas foetus]|uniref:Initiator binding domain-containing protein n=1 Tax=Tritrichomonas foetus TaxID=1144522 RepID=A0A1J4K5Z6_9EUKA|nr:hypothetical protein TRFO_25327 [Tritrichomonas foetus]|eukprot:OHT06587.1 hypothetical protein TRFO_25327 [Tritrichomonas foetus]
MIDAARQSSRGADFHPHPVFWERLPTEDKAEFIRLRNQLHSYQKPTGKDPRVVTFRKELLAVLKFIERDEAHREERSILAGIAFAGPFICVNTRLLKSFLGRCKSSINGGFQQMGYVAIRTKAKARTCIVTVMRSLTSDPALLRQWTVRGASPHADSCFVSSFNVALLPDVTQADMNFDSRSMSRSNSFFVQKPVAQLHASSSQHTSSNSQQQNNNSHSNQITLSSLSQVLQKLDAQQHEQKQQSESLAAQYMRRPFAHVSESFVGFDDEDGWNIPAPKDELMMMSCDYLDEPKWDLQDFSMTRSISSIDLDGDWLRTSNDWAAL